MYKKENIDSYLEQLSNLELLTTKGTLIPASKSYFSNEYKPRLEIENILDDDIFLSKEYLDLDENKDEIKRFFKFMRVQESIEPKILKRKIRKSELINEFKFSNDYFKEDDKKFIPYISTFTADEYENLVFIKFITRIDNYQFSKLFWDYLINNNLVSNVNLPAQAYWGNDGYPGRNTGNRVENYPKWYIKNNKCLPTTKGTCEKSIDIFLNLENIKKIAGKYLPVFDGVELNQYWKSFFNFKSELKLEDYLELLVNIMDDKNDDGKIKHDNRKRVQLIYEALLKQSINWGISEIEKVKLWSKIAFLTDENDNIVLSKELKYYADGDNSIFQNTHNFISLDEENKSHQNIEIFLGYLGIEILRQDSFSIDFEGEKKESDLKYKLDEVFPYLEKWIQKFNSEFDIVELNDKLNKLQINEAYKLLLVYNGIHLKRVQVHLKEDELLITTPWNLNRVMLDLPKVLCSYFSLHGYEDKLEYLLRENDLKEVHEYFESENIELPTIQADKISKEEAIATLGTTEKEFNELKQISDNFQHTSQSDIEKLEYVQRLLNRSKERILEYLQSLDEYDCENVDSSALTILSGG